MKAIIWNVLPNVRKDALLSKQARLINLFKPKQIWQNVVIICKQSRNPDDDAQGALAAARAYNPKAEPPILGFTFIDDASLTSNQKRRFEKAASLREDFHIKTDDEVRQAIFGKIASLKAPVQGDLRAMMMQKIPLIMQQQRSILQLERVMMNVLQPGCFCFIYP